MSNQNFDTNSPITPSDQPLPIAKQLGAQSYLSQIQDKRQALAEDAEETSAPEELQRFSSPATTEKAVPQRENKMDAFFRQVEEEERQAKLDKENLASEQLEAEQLEAEQPTTGVVETNETPVVELPVLPEIPSVDLVQEEFVQADLGQAELEHVELEQVELPELEQVDLHSESHFESESIATPTTPSQGYDPYSSESGQGPESSPFSASSFGSNDNDPPFEQPFSPSQQDIPDNVAPAVVSEPQPQEVEAQRDGNQYDLVNSEEGGAPEGNVRPLTGSAALAAGMAAAGMGSLAAQLAGDTAPDSASNNDAGNGFENEASNTPQPALPSVDQVDPFDQLRQQMAEEEQAVQSRSALATYQLPNENAQTEPFERQEEQFNVAADPQQFGDDQQYENQQSLDVASQNDASGDISDDASPAKLQGPALAMDGGFSEGFIPTSASSIAPVAPVDESANAEDQQSTVENDPFAVAENQPAAEFNQPAAEDDQPTAEDDQPAAENDQPTAEDDQPTAEDDQPTAENDQPVAGDNDGVEDARDAAQLQAQRIKAERARERINASPAPARPYGAKQESQEDQPSTSLSNPFGALSSDAPPSYGEQDIAGISQPQGREEQESRLIEDEVDADGKPQRRPFPLELFNHQLLRDLTSGVVFVDHQRRVQVWSKGAETLTGIIAQAVLDRPLYPQTFNLRFDDSSGVPLEQCPVAKCIETVQNVSGDYRILNAANQEVRIELSITPVIDEDRYVNGAILIFDDHSAEIDLQRQLKDLYEFSVLDPLTQVANRAEFERVLEEYVRAFNQSDSFSCSIIICDIDYFKSINDNFGHAVGDQALVAFAEMLKTYVRAQDLVARYGGEEFVILCADCDTDSALQRAEQIRIALFKTEQAMLDGKSISASFGVSELRPNDTAMEFFVRADTALLKAKELGRNRVVIADQREATRSVGLGGQDSLSGMQWRQQRREHTALVCEEYKTNTPVPVLVEKLRGFIVEKNAWLQRVDQEFLSMEVEFEDPRDYSRKGSFTLNIEFKENDDDSTIESRRETFIRISIFPGRKKKWFSTNHTDVVSFLLSELRSYLMINDEASHLSMNLATRDVRE